MRTLFTHLGPLLWLVASGFPTKLFAVEGVPRWETVLNEVLDRAQEEQRMRVGNATQLHRPADRNAGPSSTVRRPLRPAVESFVRYFQGPGANQYRASVSRLQGYRQMLTRVLGEEGLLPEMVWVGLVESGYDPAARSPKNAAGIWQLTPDTARTFGLEVGRRDERSDPEKSTRAAARYLKYLYARFGDWALTLAAYNAGEARVQGAMEQAQERDFWRLSGTLPRETQAYVPAVLAAQFLGEGQMAIDGPGADVGAPQRAARTELAPFSLSQ